MGSEQLPDREAVAAKSTGRGGTPEVTEGVASQVKEHACTVPELVQGMDASGWVTVKVHV
jgi:hypothetical protein